MKKGYWMTEGAPSFVDYSDEWMRIVLAASRNFDTLYKADAKSRAEAVIEYADTIIKEMLEREAKD